MDNCEIACEIIIESTMAYFVDDGGVQGWIPKSLIDKDKSEFDNKNKMAVLVIPEWLAIQKGFV